MNVKPRGSNDQKMEDWDPDTMPTMALGALYHHFGTWTLRERYWDLRDGVGF